MDLPQLLDTIATADWFAKIGTYSGEGRHIAITNVMDPNVPEKWDWLPTGRDETDPLHSPPLRERAEQRGMGAEAKVAALLAYKTTLVSLRRVDETDPKFTFGPHNLIHAARGGALYAAHQSAIEAVVGGALDWCSLLALYHEGYWPCGYTWGRKILVY